jgi:hypothetical protein
MINLGMMNDEFILQSIDYQLFIRINIHHLSFIIRLETCVYTNHIAPSRRIVTYVNTETCIYRATYTWV